jgi:hypothetical protein
MTMGIQSMSTDDLTRFAQIAEDQMIMFLRQEWVSEMMAACDPDGTFAAILDSVPIGTMEKPSPSGGLQVALAMQRFTDAYVQISRACRKELSESERDLFIKVRANEEKSQAIIREFIASTDSLFHASTFLDDNRPETMNRSTATAAICVGFCLDNVARVLCTRHDIPWTDDGPDGKETAIGVYSLIGLLKDAGVITEDWHTEAVQWLNVRRAALLDDVSICTKEAVRKMFVGVLKFREDSGLARI